MPRTTNEPDPNRRDWYTVEQAARYTGLSVWMIYRAAQSRALKGSKTSVGPDGQPRKKASWRFSHENITSWLRSQEVQPPAAATPRPSRRRSA